MYSLLHLLKSSQFIKKLIKKKISFFSTLLACSCASLIPSLFLCLGVSEIGANQLNIPVGTYVAMINTDTNPADVYGGRWEFHSADFLNGSIPATNSNVSPNSSESDYFFYTPNEILNADIYITSATVSRNPIVLHLSYKDFFDFNIYIFTASSDSFFTLKVNIPFQYYNTNVFTLFTTTATGANKIKIVKNTSDIIIIRIFNIPGWRTLGCNCLENCKVRYTTTSIEETISNKIYYSGSRYWIKIAN